MLYDILANSDSDSLSDIDVDVDVEVEANIEAAAGIEAYADIEMYTDIDDSGVEIEDATSSTLDSDEITSPRTPAPFPMPPPGEDSSDEAPGAESEDEGSTSDSCTKFFAKPALLGPRSDYEFYLPYASVGSTSSARTTIRRYIGSAPDVSTSTSLGAPSGSSANPIDLTNDSDDEADDEADDEESE